MTFLLEASFLKQPGCDECKSLKGSRLYISTTCGSKTWKWSWEMAGWILRKQAMDMSGGPDSDVRWGLVNSSKPISGGNFLFVQVPGDQPSDLKE